MPTTRPTCTCRKGAFVRDKSVAALLPYDIAEDAMAGSPFHCAVHREQMLRDAQRMRDANMRP